MSLEHWRKHFSDMAEGKCRPLKNGVWKLKDKHDIFGGRAATTRKRKTRATGELPASKHRKVQSTQSKKGKAGDKKVTGRPRNQNKTLADKMRNKKHIKAGTNSKVLQTARRRQTGKTSPKRQKVSPTTSIKKKKKGTYSHLPKQF